MSGSRSSDPAETELRLPRPPGFIRRFWARHPVVTDLMIAGATLLFTIAQGAGVRTVETPSDTGGVGAAWTVSLTIAACVALVWRRRWPVAVFAVAVLAQLSILLAPAPTAVPLVLVALYAVAVYRSSRACWWTLGLGCLGMAAVSVAAAASGISTLQATLNTVLGGAVMMLIGALIGVNVGNRRRYLEALIDRSRQLLRERDQQAQLAAAAERTRIAREMHDVVSHSLTVIIALSEGAAATSDPVKARDATAHTTQTARDALDQMRTMLGVLRAGDASAPLAPPDGASFEDAVTAARRAGFTVHLTTQGPCTSLSPPLALAVSRIVQEGLTNAMRHAPRATQIDVVVRALPDRVRVSVRNDGVRTGPGTAAGFGLAGLRERAGHLGGAVHAGPDGPDGWSLHAVLPWRGAPA